MPRRSILALFLLPALAACEGTVTIAGHVRSAAGSPVPHARLVTRDLMGHGVEASSDSTGRFGLTFFTTGLVQRATVEVTAEGYHPRTLRLPYRDSVEVRLIPDSLPAPAREWSAPEWLPLSSIRYGVPLRLSYTFGISRVRFSSGGWFAGPFLAAETGDGGYGARAGYLRQWGWFGAQFGPAVLRTRHHPRGVAAGQSFAGAEARFLVSGLSLAVGGYGRIAGSAPGDQRLVSFSAGVGF
ncbi:MAG TPA: carboxypeptidase-like regulatory domain-containing protein [Longimicrobiaceae bacterium]|nr:carboxypeptidase-like regulatory domain-containing protein [Longimicrobiaceae bacterium]